MNTIQQQLACAVLFLAGFIICTAEKSGSPAQASATAETNKERFVDIFMPFQTDRAALSPDGKYVAYTLREDENLSVVVLDVDNPAKATAKVTVVSDTTATPMVTDTLRGKVPATIRWMRWVTPTRVVVETNRNFPTRIKIGFVEQWVNCSGEIVGFDADGQNAKTILNPTNVAQWINDPTFNNTTATSHRDRLLSVSQSEEDSALALDPNVQKWKSDRAQMGTNMVTIPRSPRIIDFAIDNPLSVIVRAEGIPEASGLQEVQFYKLDVITGKLSEYSKYSLSVGKTHLFDRQGKPRIHIPSTVRDPFPHRFFYHSEAFFKPWKVLEDFAKDPMAKGFFLSPQNYFAERAIPLGFDYDPNVVYYASNRGRDTFGLYAMDMKTGLRSHLAAENPYFDLFCPAPGVFPDQDRRGRNDRDDAFADSYAGVSDIGTSDVSGDGPTLAGGEAIMAKTVSDAMFKRIEHQNDYSSQGSSAEDRVLVFDRFERKLVGLRFEAMTFTCSWFTPELQSAQRILEQRFPVHSVDIMEWNQERQRFLIRLRGNVDSGGYYVFEPAKNRLIQFALRTPQLSKKKLHEATIFSFSDAKGRNINGIFTFPSIAKSVPVPVVVLCAPYPWERLHSDYQPELQAFSEMGLAVIQVNNRGAWGFGIKHRDAIRPSYEDTQLEDYISAIDFLSKRVAINPKRVAIVGKQHGGYVAIRGLQLYPNRFRGAVAVDAMLDPESWIKENRWTHAETGPALIKGFLGSPDRLSENPVLRKADTINKPVLLLNYRGGVASLEKTAFANAKRLTLALKKNGVMSELYPLGDDYVSGLPRAKADVFQHIEAFLNTYIYEYKVEFGELKQVKDN